MRMRGNVTYRVVRGELMVCGFNVDVGRYGCFKAPKPPYAYADYELSRKARAMGLHVYATDLVNIYGKPVVVIEGETPSDIKRFRDKAGYNKTYEADIPYVRRLMIDGEIIASYERDAVAYVDIEVEDSRGFPEPGDRVLSIAYKVGGGATRFLHIDDFENGRDMVQAFLDDTLRRGATIFTAWNAGFDWLYLYAFSGIDELFDFEVIDLYDAYKKNVKGLPDYRLETVAEYENLEGVETKKRTKRVSEMTREELEEYNVGDVELIAQLDDKYGFTSVAMKLAEYVNLTVSQAYYASPPKKKELAGGKKPKFEYKIMATRVGDSLLIPRARELGYVLPNVPRRKKKPYPGAYVHEPKPGFYRRVGVYDFASMYPNIIVNYKVDVFNFKGELLPYIQEKLLRQRAGYKKLYKMTGDPEYNVMQLALKVMANALYGLFGTEGSRYLDEKKAGKITEYGRMLILTTIEKARSEWGQDAVIYGDTDSVFLNLEAIDVDPEKVADIINSWVAPFKVKLEYTGRLLIQAKKRYILLTDDGEWVVKGIELRRGDWDAFTKMVVEEVTRRVFNGEDYKSIKAWLGEVKAKLYIGEYDELLVITKSIDVHKKYKNDAEHVRAWKLMGAPKSVDEVRYVYVKTRDRVAPLLENMSVADLKRAGYRIDYGRYWNKAYDAVRRVLDPIKKMNVKSFF